ncbi:hypothetical protein JOB18_018719 [Solea senegalensis]|nr:hypothetical protein JOB18_018719 [Solea senegalensis]
MEEGRASRRFRPRFRVWSFFSSPSSLGSASITTREADTQPGSRMLLSRLPTWSCYSPNNI